MNSNGTKCECLPCNVSCILTCTHLKIFYSFTPNTSMSFSAKLRCSITTRTWTLMQSVHAGEALSSGSKFKHSIIVVNLMLFLSLWEKACKAKTQILSDTGSKSSYSWYSTALHPLLKLNIHLKEDLYRLGKKRILHF